MKVKVVRTDAEHLEFELNKIGWENILSIVPEHCYDGALMIIIFKEQDK